MNHYIAFETARIRVEQANRRASFMGSLGQVPGLRPLRPFRRQVIALPGVVELKKA
ncbi:MAG TPA: hypothetical protein PJ994_05810 [Tepidiformaceae bacterium]|nr:hypothetical protein [Tepidiformaceae bacterium]